VRAVRHEGWRRLITGANLEATSPSSGLRPPSPGGRRICPRKSHKRIGTYVDTRCAHLGRGAHFAREKVRTAYLGIKGAHSFQKECARRIATELHFRRKSRKRIGTYVDLAVLLERRGADLSRAIYVMSRGQTPIVTGGYRCPGSWYRTRCGPKAIMRAGMSRTTGMRDASRIHQGSLNSLPVRPGLAMFSCIAR
jgi:hypothetical protein